MIRKLILKILEAIGGNVFYIGGNDVLPPPLSPEEEKKIIAYLMRRGFSWEDIRREMKEQEDALG